MRRLWGRLSSVNVQKAVWGLEELGLPYERVEAGGAFGRVHDPEYVAMNPNSLVPVMEEEGPNRPARGRSDDLHVAAVGGGLARPPQVH